jgi:hypothetical protein
MIGEIPIVSFDTSAHNRLAGDTRSEILDCINSTLWFRFAGSCVEELSATATSEDRNKLFTNCCRLQHGPSDCVLPSNLLTEQLVLAHFNAPKNFDWRTVNVRWSDCERAIRDPRFFDDEQTAGEQRAFQRERKMVGKQDRERKRTKRSDIQAIFEKQGEAPPTTFQPAISRLQKSGRSVWAAAERFYDRFTKTDTDDATVEEFMSVCPPFRALVYATFVPWYHEWIRDYQAGEKLKAGANDLFMSVYLPYCDTFVTDDDDQEKSLRAVASASDLETKVLSYDDFCTSSLVTV